MAFVGSYFDIVVEFHKYLLRKWWKIINLTLIIELTSLHLDFLTDSLISYKLARARYSPKSDRVDVFHIGILVRGIDEV